MTEAVVARVASIGECMVELRELRDGHLARGYGGDTLNAATYLARLGVAVDYVTALGDDDWSAAMMSAWRADGVGTDLVEQRPGRMPGLYVIQTDERGERRFKYWRDQAPARELFASDKAADALGGRLTHEVVFFSGITLSLYGDEGRARFFDIIEACRERGAKLIFDVNFRPRGWPLRNDAERAFRRAFSLVDTLFASEEDLRLVFGEAGIGIFMASTGVKERILKSDDLSVRLIGPGIDTRVATDAVKAVDTTGAGDSFAAGYLAARLRGRSMTDAAAAGHRLANVVVRHPGAIIPRDAMPDDLFAGTPRRTGST